MVNGNQLFVTVTYLLNVILEREYAHLLRRELTLVTRNTQLGGSPDGFKHMGVIYSHLPYGTMRSRGHYTTVDRSLLAEISALSTDRLIIEADRDRIKQALTLVLRDCRNFQDIRDALPNGLKDFIPECRHLDRTRKEAFTLADNPRSYTQYMKIREKIEYYVATRLLY